ncbi:MAG TPA: aldehyde dehydrogenase family protein [Candidatus Babeliales bacterium]|jgi:succinate-semialdehyde dehydrogenase/glutarate-semialdehyde dehydrogenase|nr:aldehyde dehydrogenase family protein [Candidatus Babeliales bacterium]
MEFRKLISVNPSNYEVIGEIDSSTHHEIDAKIIKARKTQPAWTQLTVAERVTFLRKLSQAFTARRDDIKFIMAKEMGMPISLCDQIEIDMGLRYLQGYLDYAEQWLAPEITYETDEEIHILFFEPRGVAGISIPWNYPFSIFIWGVIQNLIVGNTVVVKHSEECLFTGKLLEEIMQSANLSDGVFNAVYGNGNDVGEYLMTNDIDLIWFTGSTSVGKHLNQCAAQKFIPAILELGGSAAGIVFEDADIEMMIASIYFNRFINSGQTCDGLKRLLVHHTLFDEVVEKLKHVILTKKIGSAEDPSTDIGPLVAKRQVVRIEEQVADALQKGAQIIIGGKRPSHLKGAYYEPTILTNITFDMAVWKEEVFGPVMPIVSFKSEDEAIALANDSQYGLGGYVYTQNKERALRVSKALQTGNISVNGITYVIPQDPFGGYKNSGLAREHGKQGLRELCLTKLVALKK